MTNLKQNQSQPSSPQPQSQPKKDLLFGFKKIAVENIDGTNTDDSLLTSLKRWWCRYYKRPYKDPLLGEYTLEELLVEYYEQAYMDDAEELEKIRGKIKGTYLDDDDWAKAEFEKPVPEKIAKLHAKKDLQQNVKMIGETPDIQIEDKF